MGIQFANGGFLTTIQDKGREGYQEFGISESGAMDRRSLALANRLVGNARYEAAVEVTLMGPTVEFTTSNTIAVTGGDLGARLNGKPVPLYEAMPVKKGDCLSFMGVKSGCRGYIAFAGGLDIPKVMGSKATDRKLKLGGFQGRKLAAGDFIRFKTPKTSLANMDRRKTEPDDFSQNNILLRILMGPQNDCFTEEGIYTFLNSTYTVTNDSDRMGCRLEGDWIQHRNGGDIITDGIAFGAVQVPSHGQPIIMMADRQTTGGYTKIANVISVDLPKIAQAKPGCTIEFRKVAVEEAQTLYLEELQAYKRLRETFETKEEQEAFSTRTIKYRAAVNGKTYEVVIEK